MPSIHYRATFFNPTKVHKAPLSVGIDALRLRSAAAEHLEHARHAKQRGDHIAVAYHESRHQYLTSMRGKAATLLAARTGIQVGHQAGETFGLNIKKGFSPVKHTHTRTLFGGGAAKPAAPAPAPKGGGRKKGGGGGHGGGGGVKHSSTTGRFV